MGGLRAAARSVAVGLATLALAVPLAPGAAGAPQRCLGAEATIVGTAKADRLRGTPRADVIVGLGGDDVISGLGGDDRICSGDGDDLVNAGGGRDRVHGGEGRDRLNAGGGAGDVLEGRGDRDTLVGGPGTQFLQGGEGNDTLSGGGDRDELYGDAGDDTLRTGGGFSDGAWGGAGDDTIFVQARGGFGRGEAGEDTLVAEAENTALDGGADDDALSGSRFADALDGGEGDDTISAGGGDDGVGGAPDGADVGVEGGPGNDRIVGGAGRDVLRGGAGDDVLTGGAGPDRLYGESENDVCGGGAGDDYCHGGSPGPEENTFDDPDICEEDVETMASCSDDGPPEVFVATASGEGTYAPDADVLSKITWTMSFRMVMADQVGEDVYYEVESGTGSYRIDGHTYDCTISGADGFTVEDWMGDLRLSLDTETYDFGIGNGASGQDTTWDCPSGSWPHKQFFTVGGSVAGLPLVPDSWAIEGAQPRANGAYTESWSWHLAPPVSPRPPAGPGTQTGTSSTAPTA